MVLLKRALIALPTASHYVIIVTMNIIGSSWVHVEETTIGQKKSTLFLEQV